MPDYSPLLPTQHAPRPEDDQFVDHDRWDYCSLSCVVEEFWCYWKTIFPITLVVGLLIIGLVLFIR